MTEDITIRGQATLEWGVEIKNSRRYLGSPSTRLGLACFRAEDRDQILRWAQRENGQASFELGEVKSQPRALEAGGLPD